jgi:hypothetical protein
MKTIVAANSTEIIAKTEIGLAGVRGSVMEPF